MTGIECNQGHIFSMIIDSESNNAEWKLEEWYYKAQGCYVIKSDELSFSKPENNCSHCSILEHKFEDLIEEIKDGSN